MIDKFRVEENWIVPLDGTFGNKAKNLYDNRKIIREQGWLTPRSMVIPYEYLGVDFTAVTDAIYHYFANCKSVAVRSNSPDEDLGERTPGLYYSEEIELDEDLEGTAEMVEMVVKSYDWSYPTDLRRQRGLPYKGMSLLVQEFIPGFCSGSFSDIGEIAILTITNPSYGVHAMVEEPVGKYRVDLEGRIVSSVNAIPVISDLARASRNLASSLPSLEESLGWELEFVVNQSGRYVLQTTPIKKQSSFRILVSDGNIFQSREVIGWGNFRTNGVLYLPFLDLKLLYRYSNGTDCCCITNYNGIGTGNKDKLNYLNSRVLICIEDFFPGVHPFSAHISQFIRGGERCALLGKFTNPWNEFLLSSKEADEEWSGKGIAAKSFFSPTYVCQ